MDSPRRPQLPPMPKKDIISDPPVLGMNPRRLAISFLLQASVLSIVAYQMMRNGQMEVITNYIESVNPWSKACGLLDAKEFILLSDNVVRPFGTAPGYVHVRGRSIVSVVTAPGVTDRQAFAARYVQANPAAAVLDYGSAFIGPGLVDVHVHINTPGRDDWEGVASATRAAAAGGITTLLDMPLNSEPVTTSVANLKAKRAAWRSAAAVDVAAWAGIVPANAHDGRTLRALHAAGARGFKSFMSPSGMDSFPNVSLADIAAAVPVLKQLGAPYLIHAELVDGEVDPVKDPRSYSEFLARRPERYEINAIRGIIDILRKDKTQARPGFVVHIVHLVAGSMLPELAAAKAEGLPISVETCPHYLVFAAEDVAAGDTRFSCMPPIRSAANREALWAGLAAGTIDILASDHSPSPPELKRLDTGDFTAAWGGIAGLQYCLPASWHGAEAHGVNASAFFNAWARRPAALAGFQRQKGALTAAHDADIVVFDPEALADMSEAARLHRHAVTPYDGIALRGKVLATFVRGQQVFDSERGVADGFCGMIL